MLDSFLVYSKSTASDTVLALRNLFPTEKKFLCSSLLQLGKPARFPYKNTLTNNNNVNQIKINKAVQFCCYQTFILIEE